MWRKRNPQKIHPLSAAEYLAWTDPPILVDVRRPDEYREHSIPGSIHLELAEILDGQWQNLLPYKEKGIILQCRSGMRSIKAAKFLAKQGFDKLWNLEGGILAYEALGRAQE